MTTKEEEGCKEALHLLNRVGIKRMEDIAGMHDGRMAAYNTQKEYMEQNLKQELKKKKN